MMEGKLSFRKNTNFLASNPIIYPLELLRYRKDHTEGVSLKTEPWITGRGRGTCATAATSWGRLSLAWIIAIINERLFEQHEGISMRGLWGRADKWS